MVVFLGVVFSVVGVMFVFIGYFFVKGARKVEKWVETKGVVIDSKVVSHPDLDNNQAMFAPVITYRFKVGEDEYTSSDYGFIDLSFDNPRKAERIAKKYPVGKEITVYYNPEKPYKAVLVKKSNFLIYIPLFLGCLFALIGFAILFFR